MYKGVPVEDKKSWRKWKVDFIKRRYYFSMCELKNQ
jgi:hypothetical protein